MACNAPSKTVVVLGGAYGGARAAQLIAAGLPDGWRIVLIDRNSHVNHVYILPRLAVLAGHEHKAFVPYTNIFNVPEGKADPAKYTFIRAHIRSLSANSVKLSRAFPELGIDTDELRFDYAVYALGSHLPSPLNLWHGSPEGKPAVHHAYGGTKAESITWLKGKQRAIEEAGSVLVVGGGALGIQFATDIAEVYPEKRVTLLHSRARLLPRFDGAMHTEILQALESANVDVILGERLDLAATGSERTVRTTTGRSIAADLVLLCTGQRPNTELLRALDPHTVDPSTALARVLRTMQLGVLAPPPSPQSLASNIVTPPLESASASLPAQEQDDAALLAAALEEIALLDADTNDESSDPVDTDADPEAESPEIQDPADAVDDSEPTHTPYPHIFVVGDAADAFGAIPAGHNAYYQAEVAARNVLRLIDAGAGAGADAELDRYTPGVPAIKVSLGLKKNVYQVNGVVGVGKETRDDLNAAAIWGYFGCPVSPGEEDGEGMRL
ncbi:hypothetical protein DFH06DRAFT_1111764 [Mycena polygramma]|nr:hypothetical protein DFH06DRAFT_1111764 [Mycena polygramma]